MNVYSFILYNERPNDVKQFSLLLLLIFICFSVTKWELNNNNKINNKNTKISSQNFIICVSLVYSFYFCAAGTLTLKLLAESNSVTQEYEYHDCLIHHIFVFFLCSRIIVIHAEF